MADGKACTKCGKALSGQDIIGGKAKLVGGQLVCAACAVAGRPGAGAGAPGHPAAPGASASARAAGPAAPAAQRPVKKEEAPLALPPDEPAPAKITTMAGESKATVEAGDGREEAESTEIVTAATMGAGARHEIKYRRDPRATGVGAIRVRTFDTKLTRAALVVMDEQINAWLDETGYEVKFVSNTIGEIQGKTTEAHLIVSLWY